MEYIDQQGHKIKLGVAYLFVYGMPGPDVSAMIVEGFNDDGTVNGWDVCFKFSRENVKTDTLWRPLKYKWEGNGARSYIVEYSGEKALDLTP